MHTPITVFAVFIACPILALPFIIRIACALFSKKVANQIRKHPIYHGIWGCIALVGILAFIRGFTPSNQNPYDDEPRYKFSSWYVNSWPDSIIVYETTNWKPVAHWKCPYPGTYYEYFFGSDETLYQIRANELNAFDISRMKSVEDN